MILGICLQINNLYNELTVKNCIEIYSMIKNIKADYNILKDIDLENNKENKIIDLTESQKRKLCVALAFIGEPKYVFLDEPTLGLDYSSRKKIWDFILSKKKERIIILVTNNMEEADIITDRKIIISNNKTRCIGSSLYLKEHFNMKYNINIETRFFDEVNEIIKNHIPESYYYTFDDNHLLNSNTDIRTWKLPISSSPKFPELFNELDTFIGEDKLIKSYNLSIPTLEELFIQLVNDNSDNNNNTFLNDDLRNSNSNSDANTIFVDAFEETLDNLPYSYEAGEITSSSYINGDDNNDDDTILINSDNELTVQEDKFSNYKLFKYLVKLRLDLHLSNPNFICFCVILPVIIAGILYKLFDLCYDNIIFNGFDTYTNIYDETLFNIDINNMNIPNFTKNIFMDVVNENYKYDSFYYNVTEYNSNKINEIGKTLNKKPYYISSISGSLENNNNYKINIYYNATVETALPFTINAITNTILASKNITEKLILDASYTKTYNENNHLKFLFSGIIIGLFNTSLIICSTFYGPLIVKEKNNQLDQQLQLIGISKINYWLTAIIANSMTYYISIFCLLCSLLWKYSYSMLIPPVIIALFISSILW